LVDKQICLDHEIKKGKIDVEENNDFNWYQNVALSKMSENKRASLNHILNMNYLNMRF